MARPEVVIDGVAIVIRGYFNPAIVSPGWLLAQELINADEFLEAKVPLVTPEFGQFETAWFDGQVTKDTLQLSTVHATEFERLRDVAIGILSTLPFTPILALGINRQVHASVGSREEWHAIGDVLAPKEPWGDALHLPGTKSLTLWGVRQDLEGGRIHVTVEPSVRVPLGIYVAHNDHYALTKVERQPQDREELWEEENPEPPTSDKIPHAIEILTERWRDSMQRAERLFGQVWAMREPTIREQA